MKNYFFSLQKKVQYKLFAGDIFLIAVSIFLAYSTRIYLDGGPLSLRVVWERFHIVSLIFFFLHPAVLYVLGLYLPAHQMKGMTGFLRVFWAVIIAGALTSAILFFAPRFLVGRKILLIHLPLLSVLLYAWRQWIFRKQKKTFMQTPLGLVGRADIISSFIEEAENDPYSEYIVKNIYIRDGREMNRVRLEDWHVNLYHNIENLLQDNNIQAIAIDTTVPLARDEIRQIFDFRFKAKKAVYDITELYQSITGKVPLSYIDGRWFLSNPGFQGSPKQRFLKVKRLFDLGMASFMTLLTAPLMLLVALCIRLESKGPIFYVQERLGMNRRPFRCYKFRTMVKDAESKTGPLWSSENDIRLTRIGGILRKTRLDELPQLFNIFRGELSFIGPRPIREYFANQFEPEISFYEFRYNVKPGLTGWAQVNGCYAVPFGLEALQYELFYIQNMSVVLDMIIIIKTIRTMVGRMGK